MREERRDKSINVVRFVVLGFLLACCLATIGLHFWKNIFQRYRTYAEIVANLPLFLAFFGYSLAESILMLHPKTAEADLYLFPLQNKNRARVLLPCFIGICTFFTGMVIAITATEGMTMLIEEWQIAITCLLFILPGQLTYMIWNSALVLKDENAPISRYFLHIGLIFLLIGCSIAYLVLANLGFSYASMFLLSSPLTLIGYVSFTIKEEANEE